MGGGDEKILTMKSEVVDHLQRVTNLFGIQQKIMEGGASQFQKFRLNFHKFQALFSARL
jgi:hypothetical protein